MPATEQTIRMVQAALTADPGVSEGEVSTVLSALRGNVSSAICTGPDKLLDEKAVQTILAISHVTLWRLEKRGKLVPGRIGRARRYSQRQIERYIQGLSHCDAGSPVIGSH